ncbi:putative defense protein 3 isoform X1 [Ruditapes philippinarum]|uniref:putative defense protein 3 isoform X1 n=1 Tax=Ruditapes philippinarum TaxID=129788 RepID=UPI00295C2937|nr:putative defense protein 3 isoform X1 [Ruditapes philippinarum]
MRGSRDFVYNDFGASGLLYNMKFLLLVGFCCMATGFPNGAPDIACKEMVPGHLPTVTSGDNPFKLNISVTSYKPGDVITGELYSAENIKFRGFLIEVGTAQDVSEKEEGVGEFINLDTGIQKHVCGKAGITHINNQDKLSVKFSWKAPDTSAGDLSIR